MSILEMKEKLHKIIEKSNEEEIVEMLLLFNKHESSTKDDINIEAYNKEIDEAMKEMDNGDFVSHEDVVARIRKLK